ncbi:unnamed protein product [Blepharisma stoltei]|uniref:Uncharacterized protein n=1 Tax=Blepharisma stoltei TaxID=1481888 RepID=A0AAU9K0V3_9CILI|nr:unnamed protein product [Blepharisma stoltei]
MSEANPYIDSQQFMTKDELKEHLSRSGELDHIKSLFASLLASNDLRQNRPSLKEPLKQLVCSLIDELTEPSLNDGSEETRVSVDNSVTSPRRIPENSASLMSLVAQRKENLKNRIRMSKSRTPLNVIPTSEVSQSQTSKNLHSSISRIELSRSKQLSSHFSEFSNITGCGSFTTAKRRLLEIDLKSPGPAAYAYDENIIKGQSPKAIIPSNSKRYSYLNETASPGPNYYYPSRHFMAKY